MTTRKSTRRFSFGRSLGLTAHVLRVALEDSLRDLDLTPPQFALLSVLHEAGEPTSGRGLAQLMCVRPQTINEMLAPLERRGLISRNPHPEHGRIIESTTTPEGEALRKSALARVRTIERTMTRSIDPREIERCIDTLAAARLALAEPMATSRGRG